MLKNKARDVTEMRRISMFWEISNLGVEDKKLQESMGAFEKAVGVPNVSRAKVFDFDVFAYIEGKGRRRYTFGLRLAPMS